MTSRERVLTVLAGGLPDRVPWVENYVSNEVMAGLVGHDNFIKATYSQKIERPGMIRVPPEIDRYIPLDNLSYDLAPPRFAKTERLGGQEHITEGLIKTKAELKLLEALPDPDDESLYEGARKFLERHRGEKAMIATLRTGVGNTYLSMGIDRFCAAIVLEPELVKEVLWRFSQWSRRVAGNLEELPFDLYWIPDDIGFGHAPMISPEHFREFCLPVMKNVIEVMTKPVVYHSDGNIMPLVEDLLGLGLAGLANLEPGPMDIEAVKRLYGRRVTLIGNIDLHYTLTQGSPEETEDEVRRRIEALAPGGRYILSSANSLPNYVKPENVKAMGRALLKHGFYDRLAGQAPAAAPEPEAVQAPRTQAAPAARAPLADSDRLDRVRRAVVDQDKAGIAGLVRTVLAQGETPERIINEALIPAMDEVGRAFAENRIFVPEMLVAALTMKEGLHVVKPLLGRGSGQGRGRVLMATVKGDLHDIGKNIVAMMLEGAGFEVIDLGINVEGRIIVDKIKELRPQVLGLSSLLTTTMPEMVRVIKSLAEAGLRDQVRVMVGGAPLNARFAAQAGADGYGPDAAAAVDLCRRLVGTR